MVTISPIGKTGKFSSGMKRLDRPNISVIVDREEAEGFCKELLAVELVSVDSEWVGHERGKHGYKNGNSFCWTFCYRSPNNGELQLVFLLNYGEGEGNVHALSEYWRREKHIKLLHNAPSDFHILCNDGIVPAKFCWDTMVMDHLLDENREFRHDLKECVWDFLGVDRKDFNHTFGTPRLTV